MKAVPFFSFILHNEEQNLGVGVFVWYQNCPFKYF